MLRDRGGLSEVPKWFVRHEIRQIPSLMAAAARYAEE